MPAERRAFRASGQLRDLNSKCNGKVALLGEGAEGAWRLRDGREVIRQTARC